MEPGITLPVLLVAVEKEKPFKVFDGLSGVERTGCGVEGKDSGIGLEGGSCVKVGAPTPPVVDV